MRPQRFSSRRPRLFVISCLVVFGLVPAAAAADQPVKLTFWHLWGGGDAPYAQQVVDAFNEAYRGRIEVEMAEIPAFYERFDVAVAGTDNTFDFNLQQVSINDERKQVVTFSDPYYTSNQAVLGYADGPAKDVTKLSDLKQLRLGVAADTTSQKFVTDVIKPDAEPFIYNDNADAKTALDNKQIDAIVTDLPTGLYISAVEIEGTKVFGQFSTDAGGAGDQWGLVLAKDSPLAECINIALADLTSSGTLAKITQQWMGDYTEAPVLSND
mgnify:CR=1 FL=1